MQLCKNYLYGMMQTNWSIKNISRSLRVNNAVARMYFQPCNSADEVNRLLQAIANLAD